MGKLLRTNRQTTRASFRSITSNRKEFGRTVGSGKPHFCSVFLILWTRLLPTPMKDRKKRRRCMVQGKLAEITVGFLGRSWVCCVADRLFLRRSSCSGLGPKSHAVTVRRLRINSAETVNLADRNRVLHVVLSPVGRQLLGHECLIEPCRAHWMLS